MANSGELGHRERFTKADSESAAFFKRSGSRSPDVAASSKTLAMLASAKALSMGVASASVASHSCTAAFLHSGQKLDSLRSEMTEHGPYPR